MLSNSYSHVVLICTTTRSLLDLAASCFQSLQVFLTRITFITDQCATFGVNNRLQHTDVAYSFQVVSVIVLLFAIGRGCGAVDRISFEDSSIFLMNGGWSGSSFLISSSTNSRFLSG